MSEPAEQNFHSIWGDELLENVANVYFDLKSVTAAYTLYYRKEQVAFFSQICSLTCGAKLHLSSESIGDMSLERLNSASQMEMNGAPKPSLYSILMAGILEKSRSTGPSPIGRLPDSLLLYIFELDHGEDTIPHQRGWEDRSTIRSIIRVCRRWHGIGIRVMLRSIYLEVGQGNKPLHFRRGLLRMLDGNEALLTCTRKLVIVFTDRIGNEQYRYGIDDSWLLRCWSAVQEVVISGIRFSHCARSAKRLMWQLAKMPLKELRLDNVSLAFFLKYFHFPGLRRLSWGGIGWCDNPDQLLGFRSDSSASNTGQRLLLPDDRARFIEIKHLSVSNPRLPAEKLKLLFQACASLRRFEAHYMCETEDAQYTVNDLQQLLDIQAESIREIALGHIFDRNGHSPGDCRDMIDFTRMAQLQRLSLNADNVFCLDPEYFAAIICAPWLTHVTINFDSEAQYGVYSSRLKQSTHDWLVRFATARFVQVTKPSRKLCVHLGGGLDYPYIDHRTFDTAEELFIEWTYPWDYLEAARQKLEACAIEMTWTMPEVTKEEWRTRLLSEWKDRHLTWDERYPREDSVAEIEPLEDESSRAENDHDHDPSQRRFCQDFLVQHARRSCVH